MGQSKTRQRRQTHRFLLSGATFTAILVTIVIARTVTFFAVTHNNSCEDALTLWRGASAFEYGVFDTLLVLVAALACFVIATTINGLVRQDYTKLDIVLGGINASMVAGLVVFCAIPWAFSNPTAPFAKEINSLNQIPTLGIPLSEFQAYSDAPYRVSSNWVKTGPNEWRSESLYLIKKYEIVWECFPEGFVRENASARHQDYNPETPVGNLKYGYSYYNLNGEYLTSGEVYWWKNAPHFLPYEFMPYKIRRENPENWYVGERLERDLLLLLAEIEAEDSKEEPRLYSLEEIEALVKESWRNAD